MFIIGLSFFVLSIISMYVLSVILFLPIAIYNYKSFLNLGGTVVKTIFINYLGAMTAISIFINYLLSREDFFKNLDIMLLSYKTIGTSIIDVVSKIPNSFILACWIMSLVFIYNRRRQGNDF